jgi:hypothetical protein
VDHSELSHAPVSTTGWLTIIVKSLRAGELDMWILERRWRL